MRQLNLGCGTRIMPDAINIDHKALPGVDVIVDLDQAALPFATDSVNTVYAYHVLEHLHNLKEVMEEIYRVCGKGGRVVIEVPYFTCIGAFGDPTHVRFFTYQTFHFWEVDTDQANWFTSARYKITYRKIVFGKAHRSLGIQWFANRFPNIYENFFAYWFPARLLKVELSVSKKPGSNA